jgi:hypothetical protein
MGLRMVLAEMLIEANRGPRILTGKVEGIHEERLRVVNGSLVIE